MPSKKLITGAAAIAVAMVLVGIGVFAVFTDTESTGVTVDTGQLDVSATNAITATDIAPGDHIYEVIDVELPAATNDGNLVEFIDVDTTFGSETFPNGGSLWNGSNGLQAQFYVCDGGAWTVPAPDAPLSGDVAPVDGLDDSVTCSGTIIQPGAPEPVNTFGFTDELDAADFGVAATATGTIPDGSQLDVLAQLVLPTAADNTYENATVSFTFDFTAVQRPGINK